MNTRLRAAGIPLDSKYLEQGERGSGGRSNSSSNSLPADPPAGEGVAAAAGKADSPFTIPVQELKLDLHGREVNGRRKRTGQVRGRQAWQAGRAGQEGQVGVRVGRKPRLFGPWGTCKSPN